MNKQERKGKSIAVRSEDGKKRWGQKKEGSHQPAELMKPAAYNHTSNLQMGLKQHSQKKKFSSYMLLLEQGLKQTT